MEPLCHGRSLHCSLSLFWVALFCFYFWCLRSLSTVINNGSQGIENAKADSRKGRKCVEAELLPRTASREGVSEGVSLASICFTS